MLIFHSDEEWLSDVRSLQRYIRSELNIRDVVFSSDEALAGVRYRAVADWSILGKKLRKDLGRVKNALPNLTSEDVKLYTQTGKIIVDGIPLIEGDLTVQRYIDAPPSSKGHGQYATHTDNDVVVRLDIEVHADLMGEWLARELINRVQKLRKKAGLQATDDVDVFYALEEGSGEELRQALLEHAEVIKKTVRSTPADAKERKAGKEVIIEEEQDIADMKFVLSLVMS